jgi:ubiquinone/menaquinone biosynthesis C-methylase UbiE
MTQLEFDETVRKRLESLYNTRDIHRRRALVKQALGASSGERILDVGCGPGFYLAELLDVVGPNGSLVGVDGNDGMLAVAAGRTAGHANVAFERADVCALPCADAAFDAALCVQVLEYVADPTAALREMHRVLRPGGRLVVADIDWTTVSWHATDGERMRRVLTVWDEHLAHPALPRTLGARMRSVGFGDVRMEGHVFAADRLDPQTYAGASIPLIAGFVADRSGVTKDEVAAWQADLRKLDERGEYFVSCVQFIFSAIKPD